MHAADPDGAGWPREESGGNAVGMWWRGILPKRAARLVFRSVDPGSVCRLAVPLIVTAAGL